MIKFLILKLFPNKDKAEVLEQKALKKIQKKKMKAALKQIYKAIKLGYESTKIFDLNESTVLFLKEKGYTITKSDGIKWYKVEW